MTAPPDIREPGEDPPEVEAGPPRTRERPQRHALTLEILKAAVTAWNLGDPLLLDEAIAKRSLLVLGAAGSRLLDVLAACRGEGLGINDVSTRLAVDPERTAEANLLDQLMRDGQLLSPTTWRELWERATVPHIGAELAALASEMASGGILSADAIFHLDGVRERLSSAAPQEDIFDVAIANDPEREPKIILPEPWIEDLLMPGYTTVSGPWKSGKTWLMLAASIAIASGRDLFGRKVKKGKPAWLQLDMPTWSFLDYCKMLRLGMDLPEVGIPFFSDGRIDLKRPDHQAALSKKIADLGIEILFIDSGRAASTVKENESDEVAGLVRKLFCAELRDRLGCSVVLITHAAKGANGGTRGSGEFDAAADSCLSFTRGEEGDPIQVTGRGRHPGIKFAFEIEDLTEHGLGVALREAEPAEKAKAKPKPPKEDVALKVENLLRGNVAWFSIKAIKEQAGGRHQNVKAALMHLLDKALIEHDGEPESRRRWRWCLNCRPGVRGVPGSGVFPEQAEQVSGGVPGSHPIGLGTREQGHPPAADREPGAEG